MGIKKKRNNSENEMIGKCLFAVENAINFILSIVTNKNFAIF